MVIMQRLPYRGGNWNNAGNAGLAALNLNNSRSNRNTNIGFRARFRVLMRKKLIGQGLSVTRTRKDRHSLLLAKNNKA